MDDFQGNLRQLGSVIGRFISRFYRQSDANVPAHGFCDLK